MHLQNSLHLGKGLTGLGDPGTNCLGTVHTGTAAEADNGFTVVCMVKLKRFCHIVCSRVGYCFVIKDIRNAAVCQRLFQTVGKPKLMNACICDDQHILAFFLFQHIGNFLQAADDLRVSVRQKGKCELKHILENSAVYFLYWIHNKISRFLVRFLS